MEKVEKVSGFRRFKRITARVLLGLMLFLLVSGILLSLPVVQTKIGHYVTNTLNEDYGTDIQVEEVAISVFGGVKLKSVMIRDHHKDTLIYANRIKTNLLDVAKLTQGDLLFGDLRLDGLVFNLKKYKKEEDTNLDIFIALFRSDKVASKKKFLMTAKNAYFTNSKFMVIDENLPSPISIYFTKLDASLSNLKVYGSDVTTKINRMAFVDHRGLKVENLSAKFGYSKTSIVLEDLDLKTKESMLKGNVVLNYDSDDFMDFNNKVRFAVDIDESQLATNDIRYFYAEMGKNLKFDLKAQLSGTLNDLTFKNLKLIDNKNSQIIGNVNFKNLLGKGTQEFYMKGDFYKVTSNYDDLVAILPNILGKKLPSSLKKMGQFTLIGSAELTKTAITTDLFMTSALGNIKTDLALTNINTIDNASYTGNVELDNFNIGRFLDVKDVGKVSLNVSINGKGFTEKYLDTRLEGEVSQLHYNGYNYTGIILEGNFKAPIFKGKLNINDPNLFMDFEGLVDLSKRDWRYDFNAQIDYANLNALHFMKDSVSVFKGDILMNVSGNNLDDLAGEIRISNSAYNNAKDNYLFDDFNITSTFDNMGERTISINSPDIIEGSVVGKFKFKEIGKIIENAAGSLYTNYEPNRVSRGQYMRFNFSIYNKIIEIFVPDVEIGIDTKIRGNINSDKDEFKLVLNSPKVKAFNIDFDKVNVNIDNKNPLYNAYISLDSVKTKYYKVSDFNFINVTSNDTLYARTEFKGGSKGQDFYNLNFYHTIDKDNNHVVGVKKSELQFKEYLWFLNEGDTADNKIVFDKKFKKFDIQNFIMTHENQKIELVGQLRDSTYKDLQLNFENVNLGKIIPTVDSLKVAGNLNGKIDFKQNKNVYQPTASIRVDSLFMNDIELGNLNLEVEGDDSFKNFTVYSNLENKNVESFLAEGNFSIANKETVMNLDVRFDQFNMAALSPLGGTVITDIRGALSGTTNIAGNVKDLEINGRLFLDDAGLRVPYLNVDYAFQDNSIIDLTEKQFIFQNLILIDTEYDTRGRLNGLVRHDNFTDWKLDLAIQSNRLLVLNTQDSEDAAYYGTAFIDGTATISGPTKSLFIEVDATSKEGTKIKIPINNSEAVGNKSFMHFLTPQEKYNQLHGILDTSRRYGGLELRFDLDITPEAEIEVILDRETGHGIRGRGNGTLLLEINTLGKFNMIGDFQVYEGDYNFKYRGLIDKRFEVKKFSTIVWEGDPLRARLNLEAVYKTNANPSVLLDNPSVNRKVPVEVAIGITGTLSSPEPDFTINFPTISSVLKSEIQTKLDDKDIRQTQALTLLATGGFLSQEGVNQNALTQNLFETAGGIFDDIFQNPDDKLKVGIDIVSADRTPGNESDGSVGFTVSTQINERITVNGMLGVPVGGINESAIVGNVEVQYRVNDDGSLNLRVFNRENDINYIGEGIGYTQGIGITYEVGFNTFEQLVNKIFNKKKLEKASKGTDIPDSEPFPDYMNFPKKEEKPKKPIIEAIPAKED